MPLPSRTLQQRVEGFKKFNASSRGSQCSSETSITVVSVVSPAREAHEQAFLGDPSKRKLKQFIPHHITYRQNILASGSGVITAATDFDETLSSAEVTDIISSQYAHTLPPSAPAVGAAHAVVEITPSVSSFRRKRRKINSPIFVLDSSKSKSTSSDCDEDSRFKRADRDQVAVGIENTGDTMAQQINRDSYRGWLDADHLKMNMNMDDTMGTNSSLRRSLSNVPYSAARTRSLDDSDSAVCFKLQSTDHPASRVSAFEDDSKPHSYSGEGTDSCDGPKRSSRLMLKNAPASSQAHPNVHTDLSYGPPRQRDASGCSAIPSKKTSSSSGRIRKRGDVNDVTKECAGGIAMACSNTLIRRNRPITAINEPSGVANEFTRTVDVTDTKTLHAALAQPESDTCFDGNNSVCCSYSNQDCGIRSARAGPDGGCGIRGDRNSSSSSSSSSSCTHTLKIKSMILGSVHRTSSTLESGCVVEPGMQTQRNTALAVSACTSSPPKTSNEGRISGIADSSSRTRCYTAIAPPLRDGLPAPPLQQLMKKYPSTSRSRMSSSLSAAYGPALNSHSEGGSGTSSSTMSMSSGRIDLHLVKEASSGAETGEEKSVTIQPPQSVLSSSHASGAQHLSRSASVTSSASSSTLAAAIPVPPRPSQPPTSARDYRHSSFKARKMLQAAEQIVHRNKNEQL